MSDGDVGIAVEADGKWSGRKRVVSVEGVADETGGVHSSTALERGTSLDIVVERGVVVGCVGGSARSPSLGFGFGFAFMCGPLLNLPTLCDRRDRDVWWAVSPRLMRRA
jgi:hypothetical protein